MACEIIVKLKNPMKSLTRVSTPIIGQCSADLHDPIIKLFVKEVESEFNDVVQKRTITIKLIED